MEPSACLVLYLGLLLCTFLAHFYKSLTKLIALPLRRQGKQHPRVYQLDQCHTFRKQQASPGPRLWILES